ncbi:MAG: hypothetical protein ICV85_16205 [Tolypothrix sp. T3-bin4]|nr:hypothetical protein [Tolypothrix sp. Co-bin9]MBD0303647.1 hypothetical protein [Tolypothrix sp. T3-bin4]
MGISGRGGARAGGGRPSEWQNGPTCTIRVPEVFAQTLLKIAKELDKGFKEVIIVEPKSLSVNPQVKHEKLSLSGLRVYKYQGNKVMRVQELILALQQCIDQDN